MAKRPKSNSTSHNKLTQLFSRMDLLAILFPLAMIIPNIILDITETMSIWAKIANVLVPLSIYTLMMARWRRVGVTIGLLFIMIVMNAMQLVILYLYGESIIAIDMLLNCLTTNPSEASELLSNLSFPIIISAVIYIPLILWAGFGIFKKLTTSECLRTKLRKWGLIMLSIGIIFTIIAQITGPHYAVNRDMYPFNVISNIGSALGRTWKSINYKETSNQFSYNAVDTRPDENQLYVLVIGETSRAINWELFGYERPTNPKLSQRSNIIKFPLAISQSNTTHKCVPMMLTDLEPSTFDSIIYRKSIISAFNEAGYATAFFSNQAKNHSYTQFFGEEADTTAYLSSANHYDMNLLTMLKDNISRNSDRKQFIILHTYGSHFNYKERYPAQYSVFKPDNSSDANKKHRGELLNAYDNAIIYTDALIDSIVSIVEQTGRTGAVIFSSDHGEDIFDDYRNRFLHASPTPTYYQLHVPMLVWMSDNYINQYPDIYQNISANSPKYVAPSQSVFHTLLDISGIKSDHINNTNSLASPDFKSPAPVYLSDHNDEVPLEESGLKECDLENFRKIGIIN